MFVRHWPKNSNISVLLLFIEQADFSVFWVF